MRTNHAMRRFLIFMVAMTATLAPGIYGGLSFILPMAIPLLFALYSYRYRLRYAIVYAFVSASVAIMMPSGIWLVILFVYSPLGIVMGRYLKRAAATEKTIFASLIAALIGTLILLVVVQNVFGGAGLSDAMAEAIDGIDLPPELISQVEEINQIDGVGDAASLRESLKQLILLIIPALLAFALFIQCVVVYLLTLITLRKFGVKVKRPTKLAAVKLPGNPIVGTLIMVVAALFLSWILPDFGTAVTVNTMYLIIMMFAVQGLAVLAYAAQKLRVNGLFKWLIAIGALLLLQAHGLAIIGWLEAGFKIRHRINGRALK